MAEITNGISGPARLAARVDIMEGIPPNAGMVAIGPAVLNAALGVVRARVSFWLGKREICGHKVLLHSSALKGWASEVKALIEGKSNRDVIYSAMENPEMLMTIWRHNIEQEESPVAYYEFLVVLDTGVFDPETGISGEGPGVFLSPEPEALLQFAEDLLAETENALR